MKKLLSAWLAATWYSNGSAAYLLLPLSILYLGIVRLRKWGYDRKYINKTKLSVPVIVIGNISVGGTGKTPLVIWLAHFLKQQGYFPGIVSRGYGGHAKTWPQLVDEISDPEDVGDEALVIARRTRCPVAVGPSRVDSGKLLLESGKCDIILSDDGLQHYALERDIEVAVVDGMRRFGNGFCLPAGPLREPVSRLGTVDIVIVNGQTSDLNEFTMYMEGEVAINLITGDQKPLTEFRHSYCHAVAGIGNPDRFFQQLKLSGLHCQRHVFPDHYPYQTHDLEFDDDWPVLMTEKDAVKCRHFENERYWSVPVSSIPESGFSERIVKLLREKHSG